jgi:hypothetical protein
MNTNKLTFSALLLCGVLMFGACKKKHVDPSDDSSAETTAAQDQSNYSSTSNQSAEEAEAVVSGSVSGSSSSTARLANPTLSGVVIDTSKIKNNKIVLTFNGLSQSGRIRKGTDTLTLVNGPWHTANAYIISKYSYSVTHLNGKTWTLSGVDTITNVSGGNFAQLIAGTVISVTTNHVGTATIIFDDGSVRTWSHARQKVKTYSNGSVNVSISGLPIGQPGSLAGAEVKGINRFGNAFSGMINSPLLYTYSFPVLSSSCTHWWPYAGSYTHQGLASELTVTFGVSSTGFILTPAEVCPPDLKLDWTYNNTSKEAIIAY